MANYFSHIKQRKRTCAIGNHFLDNHLDVWEESYEVNETFEIKGIAMLTNVPSNPKQNLELLWEFEGYWQLKLNTIKSHGLNDINELKECYRKYHTKF